MTTFTDLGVEPLLCKRVSELGFETPTPVQLQSIPFILETNQDLVALAQTGTGKTAAFGLPLIQKIDMNNPNPQVLILAPTRELCIQTTQKLKDYAKHIDKCGVVSIYGGADIYTQINNLRRASQIIVATPGRMTDILNRRKAIKFSDISYVVLDEADEMLNMGFKEELDAILEHKPDNANTLLFSATMPQEVSEISRNYMKNPKEITVGKKNAAPENITHLCYLALAKDRYLTLKRIVDHNPSIYGIVFCRTRAETKTVADMLMADGYNADALHGDLSQSQRERIMNQFRRKSLQLLVATDVAARGIDVYDIAHIINYNLPEEPSIYTHRSGRTGRAGQQGFSHVIISPREKHHIKRIENKMKKDFKILQIPKGQDICQKQISHTIDKMCKTELDTKDMDAFLPSIYAQLEHLSKEEVIKYFVDMTFTRFLKYYKDSTDLNASLTQPRGRSKPRPGMGPRDRNNNRENTGRSRNSSRDNENSYSTLQINLGHKDSLTPRDVIGLINRCSKNRKVDIGQIEIKQKASFVEIDKNFIGNVCSQMMGQKLKQRVVSVSY